MKNPDDMTPEEIRATIAKIQDDRQKRYAYNKTYRKTHPKTEAQKASRKTYNTHRNATQKALKDAVFARAAELNLI